MRWTVDGQRFFRRFDRAADAEAFATELRRGEALRWPFDPGARRFVDPSTLTPSTPAEPPTATPETVVGWTQRYWDRKWPTLEPRGRSELARYLNRARLWLVDAEPAGELLVAIDRYIRTASLTVRDADLSEEQQVGERWLEQHSLPMASVGRVELEGLVARYSTHARDPSRRLAASSMRRMVADLRPCWDRAVLEEVIPVNPWAQVDLGLRSRAGGKRATTGVTAADADLVLDPGQVALLADACTTEGRWGDGVRAFILVMGMCGLRPNEAAGLLVGDLELPDAGPGWLTVRRNRRQVPDRFLDVEEDPDWGPLKGREISDLRRAPIPTGVVAALRTHLDRHRSTAASTDLVFERHGRPFDLRSFHTQVWAPGRAALFPPNPGLAADSPLQPKLTRLRRHDLRHSACSMWLRAGVDVTVCQRWSGHKRLSVFLDVYQGVMPGREDDGVRSVEALLRAAGANHARPTAERDRS